MSKDDASTKPVEDEARHENGTLYHIALLRRGAPPLGRRAGRRRRGRPPRARRRWHLARGLCGRHVALLRTRATGQSVTGSPALHAHQVTFEFPTRDPRSAL